MSSPSSNSNPHTFNNNDNSKTSVSSTPSFDPNSTPNTTFVQADPSNFRAVVQRLTGAPYAAGSGKQVTGEMGPRRPAFKLHERRQSARKLEIKLNNGGGVGVGGGGPLSVGSPSGSSARQRSFLGFGGEMVMVSPVSPLELLARGSPRTPSSPSEEEERAIAEKGFYLHPSPLSTPRGSEPPELLPLFPLHSPRYHSSSST